MTRTLLQRLDVLYIALKISTRLAAECSSLLRGPDPVDLINLIRCFCQVEPPPRVLPCSCLNDFGKDLSPL